MIGGLIVSHGDLGKALFRTASSIAGKLDNLEYLSVSGESGVDEIRASIADKIESLDSGDGVIVFTDMLGGTPTNVALTLMEEKNIEVITGVNLPLLIKFTSLRKTKGFSEIVEGLKSYGAGTIVVAGEILKGDS